VRNAVPEEALALRSLGGKYEAYVDEVRRLVAAGFEVMRRTGSLDPRVSEIVKEAGLSNQAFYRHFRSKDELLVALLDDGLRQLVEYIEHVLDSERTAEAKVRRWVRCVMAQAGGRDAAERTRPFVLNSLRLAQQFPDEVRRSEAALMAPLEAALRDMGGRDPARDAAAIYRLVMGTMHACLVAGERPRPPDIDHLTGFALAAVKRRA
jgi:AcrR family transcriptional regulator